MNTADPQPIRAVLVGTGMVAATHVAALQASQTVALTGLCARRITSAQAFAQKIDGGEALHIYGDIAEIAADPDVDLAIIATPPNARLDLIEPLARAGKHILLEKPVGRTAQEAREVVKACDAAGVSLGIVFQTRMTEAALKAKELLASGTLGALGVAEISVPWWRPQSYYDEPGRGTYARDGGGVLISQAIHAMDLALSMTGPVQTVQAMAATSRFHAMESEDFVTAGLTFRDGAIGSLQASTASFPGDGESITLHCDNASMRLGKGQLDVHWRDGRHDIHGAAGGSGGGADPMAFTHEWHQAIIEDMAEAIVTARPPVATGQAALAAHDLIEAITLSARDGRTVTLEQPL